MGEISRRLPPNCHPQILYTEMTREYDLPSVFYVDLWPAADPMVVLTEVEDMNYVQVFKPLAQHYSADDFMAPVVGRNVVATANGATWKMLRNVSVFTHSSSICSNVFGAGWFMNTLIAVCATRGGD